MKKILIGIIILGMLSSCSDDLSSLNVDPKSPTSVPGEFTFSYGVRRMVDQVIESNVNLNPFRFLAQQWTEVTYVSEANYDFANRKVTDSHWDALYGRGLINIKAAYDYFAAQGVQLDATDELARKNKMAICDIMMVYGYQVLVDSYGNVPYTDALNPDNVLPKYDDAKTIYMDLFARLNKDIATLKTSAPGFSPGQDIIYAGSVSKWKKFANSLKLKMALRLADTGDPIVASSVSQAVAGGVFASNDDNFSLVYQASPPNTNPVWTDLVQSGREDYAPANTIVDLMNSLSDPRSAVYFTKYKGNYVGGTYGAQLDYDEVSHIGDMFFEPDLPGTIMDYSEVLFLLAEAAERGYAVPMSAEDYYKMAIKANFEYWGLSAADADAYIATPSVAYSTATGNWKQKIGTQKYIALYNRGFEAWSSWRVLDFPVLNQAAGTSMKVPVRLFYPLDESTVNGSNKTAAISAMGGDELSTKIFWDKY